MANIEAGNEQQLVIKRLVESYGLSIGPTKAYGVICAVATLERIYTKYGYHVLDRTLRLCVGTWEGDIDSLGANVLAGVARMVVAFGDQLRDETFKERVGFMSVRQLSRIAKERGAGSLCYAEAMLVAYNRKCKYTLRMTKLHSGKVAAEDDFVEENEEPLADDPVLEEWHTRNALWLVTGTKDPPCSKGDLMVNPAVLFKSQREGRPHIFLCAPA